MSNLNYVFFEEYKHLDKLCKEMYGGDIGVTSYIDDMKAVSLREYININNWKTDLEQLTRLRNMRNDLAHIEGTFDENNCTQADIDWIKDFHRRIMEQSDPMAVLHLKNKNRSNTHISNSDTVNNRIVDNWIVNNKAANNVTVNNKSTYVEKNQQATNRYINDISGIKQQINPSEPIQQKPAEKSVNKVDNLEKKKSFSIMNFVYYVLLTVIIIMIIIMAYLLGVEFLI